MHGLVNRSIQSFVEHTYGRSEWDAVCRAADLGFTDFEPMLHYDVRDTDNVLEAIATRQNRPRITILEDIGHFLITNPKVPAPRRLLRFSGTTFRDFLYSLDDLPGRARLAVADLSIPQLELDEHGGGIFNLRCFSSFADFGYIVLGALRAMADDYGALVLLDVTEPGDANRPSLIAISLVESSYTEGNTFALGRGAA